MPATFQGQTTFGGTVPGLYSAYVEVGEALVTLRDELLLHLPCLAEAIDLLALANINIRVPAVVDFQAQLSASVAMGVQLQSYLTDPVGYLTGLLAGVTNLTISIPAMLPQVALQAQVTANAAVKAAFTAKIAAVDLQLGSLDVIAALLLACSTALTAVAAAALEAAQTYARVKALLDTAGAYAFTFNGAFADTWSALSAVASSSGITGSDNVQVTVQVVRSSSAAAVEAHDELFLTG